jgi:S-adenosylmethionine decarboxylase
MKNLAPNILRQRLLIEGFYKIDVDEKVVRKYFETIVKALGLRTYAEPIIHSPSGEGKEINQGYDAFVPLIDSGIYVGAWTNAKFFSTVIFTCKKFDENKAIETTKKFWKIDEVATHSF